MADARRTRPVVVLHVEDNDGDVILVRDALAAVDATVVLHVVQDGHAAVEFVRRQSPRPDLIILDMHLPKKSGIEVLKELKTDADHMHIPIVIFSNSNSTKEVRDAYSSHANSYIRKPLDIDEFFAAIASFEQYWARTVVLPPNNASRFHTN
jgi:chemotaxis family two-component system response regulator Rcp1